MTTKQVMHGALNSVTSNAILHVLTWVLGSCAISELLGYLLHRLLHSGWIGFLSRNHMRHHLSQYAPLKHQRPSEEYIDSTDDSIALGNVGMEWLIPGALFLLVAVGMFWFLHVAFLYQAISVTTTLFWSFFIFSYMHDRMHMKNFWMERNHLFRGWFRWARRLHDIHHRVINDQGIMHKNFGIGFAFFDWLFGTLATVQPAFNFSGYGEAKRRFAGLDERGKQE